MDWLGIDDISRKSVDLKPAQRILAQAQSAVGVRRLAVVLNAPSSTAKAVVDIASSGETRGLSFHHVALLDQARAYWRRKFDEEAKPQRRQRDLLDVLNEEIERYLSLKYAPTPSIHSVLLLNEIVQQGRDQQESPFMIVLRRDKYWAHPSIPKAVVQAIMINDDGSGPGGESSVRLDHDQGSSALRLWRTEVHRNAGGRDISYSLIWVTLTNGGTKASRPPVTRHKSKGKLNADVTQFGTAVSKGTLNADVTQFRTAVRTAQSDKDTKAHETVGSIADELTRKLGALL
jgi:hypothetical protein